MALNRITNVGDRSFALSKINARKARSDRTCRTSLHQTHGLPGRKPERRQVGRDI
jgi:hypothetical protein